ncbi:hypothetical protein HPG69_012598 [Diceros bicornis minor]|uniref:Uncharacterized protein n=1 Tax=Diceros bicornis minor TaxID=77932 RepID=A0A7J7F9G0_DICBM|nr:hypothetical protein HPG69_012598 [Diceros bicornis minor]
MRDVWSMHFKVNEKIGRKFEGYEAQPCYFAKRKKKWKWTVARGASLGTTSILNGFQHVTISHSSLQWKELKIGKLKISDRRQVGQNATYIRRILPSIPSAGAYEHSKEN